MFVFFSFSDVCDALCWQMNFITAVSFKVDHEAQGQTDAPDQASQGRRMRRGGPHLRNPVWGLGGQGMHGRQSSSWVDCLIVPWARGCRALQADQKNTDGKNKGVARGFCVWVGGGRGEALGSASRCAKRGGAGRDTEHGGRNKWLRRRRQLPAPRGSSHRSPAQPAAAPPTTPPPP